ncbi:hypothetical protein [Sphingomonas xinjiangensis]|uniref:MFS family permease n=1 Tax=Sphingomonas xinjiangensis TaxID=643568 RepID=A0A840YQ63_9SPHN|nr:hypothetical protein [Sphingomonas xinjiangensis]MBB5710123.1 MFS family permease [Sphingomonas xinjiangensis]
MTWSFSGVLADVRAIWRGERDLLVRVASVFFFLPTLAARLFLPMPNLEGATREDLPRVLSEWLAGQGGWIALQLVVLTFGSGLILVLLLDRARPTLGQAMIRTLKLLPLLLIAWTCVLFAMALGSMLLFVVALYLGGRGFLSAAAVVMRPERGPFAAVVDSVRLTARRGWMVAALAAMVFVASYLAALIFGIFAEAIVQGGGSPMLQAPLEILTAAASAAGSLAMVLLQAAIYRAATVPSSGM